MGTTRVTASSDSVTPEQFIGAMTRFDDSRASLWAYNHKEFFELHQLGDDWADVTEGTHMFFGDIWQRYHYDWSRPRVVRLEVQDSNMFGKGSWWQYEVAALGVSGCRVDLEIRRVPCSTYARFLDPGMNMMAGTLFRCDLHKTFNAIAAHSTA